MTAGQTPPDPRRRDEPTEYPGARFEFRDDLSGNPIVIRPRQFLAPVSIPADAVIAAAQDVLRTFEARKIEQLQRPTPDVTMCEPTSSRLNLFVVDGEVDVLELVRELRERGVPAQANHVYFVTTLPKRAAGQFDPNLFAPNLFAPNLFAPNLFAPNLFAPNLFAPNLFAPNLFAGGGTGGGCCSPCPEGPGDGPTRHVPKHGARPVCEPAHHAAEPVALAEGQRVSIHVIDIARPGANRWSDEQPMPATATGELTNPNLPSLTDAIDENGDEWVDPATGHGDFVASIVELNSGLQCTLWEAADPLGDIDDADLVAALERVAASTPGPETYKILNLSLSGYNADDRPGDELAAQIATMITDGWVIVASAGNNASCRLAWPAALPDVVAVGAFGRCGPAWFSNYGPWVDASALGVDVIARFPTFDDGPAGDTPMWVAEGTPFPADREPPMLTLDDFRTGWASWSGTSFSAPLVTARLAGELERLAATGVPTADARATALETVISGTDLPRLPNYGTLVT